MNSLVATVQRSAQVAVEIVDATGSGGAQLDPGITFMIMITVVVVVLAGVARTVTIAFATVVESILRTVVMAGAVVVGVVVLGSAVAFMWISQLAFDSAGMQFDSAGML